MPMPPAASAPPIEGVAEPRWRLLALLNLFRVLAATLLLLLFVLGEPPRVVGEAAPRTFLAAGLAFLLAGLGGAVLLSRRWPTLAVQTWTQLAIDLAAIAVLTHASGGVSSGLGSLLIVSAVAASALTGPRGAMFYAALASLTLLGEQMLAVYERLENVASYQQVAILGAIFFAISLIGSRLARRAQETEALAIQRGLDLANLAQLNDHIVQQLQTGVAVVDADGTLRQLNAKAAEHLGIRDMGSAIGRPVAEVAPRLGQVVDAFQRERREDPPSFQSADASRVIVPHCLPLGAGGRGAVVFLEDPQVVAERMQQLKLAALGRLTASIAHEIRNPLAAVNNANQLLEESPHLSAEDRRFTSIINTHVARVNTIIENVLQLGRRGSSRPELLDVGAWLAENVPTFQREHYLQPAPIIYTPPTTPVLARIDPSHLHQVLWNLLENALKHGFTGRADEQVVVNCGVTPGGGAWLEIADQGPGIPPTMAEHIFEPFYTGSARGTGLGLFIARELCAANRASLTHRRGEPQGAVFRVNFPDPMLWME